MILNSDMEFQSDPGYKNIDAITDAGFPIKDKRDPLQEDKHTTLPTKGLDHFDYTNHLHEDVKENLQATAGFKTVLQWPKGIRTTEILPYLRLFPNINAKKECNNNRVFRTMMNIISSDFEKWEEISNINLTIKLISVDDEDVPNWRRWVFLINTNQRNFDEKMKIWENLTKTMDAAIRNYSRKLNIKDRHKLNKFKKEIYVEMNLDE
jgi:hypothetical protein